MKGKDDANFYCGNLQSQPMREGQGAANPKEGSPLDDARNIIISSSRHQHQTLASSHLHSHPEEVSATAPPNFGIQEVGRQPAPFRDEKL